MVGRIRITESNIYPRLVMASLVLTGVLALITTLAVSVRFGLSVVAGGVLATANFFWLRRGLESVLAVSTTRAAPRIATLRYLLRLGIMALLLYLLMVQLQADLVGLLLGLSVLVINLIGFALYLSTRKGG